ncbi:MAG: ABC transporter permease subunit [Nitrospinae bacterium]|nr:ABC transporter permease subunit [Nitrospinota bacterium]
MRNFLLIFQKEIRSYFNSPIAYVVITMFLVLSGYYFYNVFASFSTVSFQALSDPMLQRQSGLLNITERVVRPFFGNLSTFLLIMLPMLTMRSFSEEKKSGTIELLLTYPITDAQVIMGKFAGCFGIFSIMLLLTIPCFGFVVAWGQPEIGVIVCGYIGVFLMGGAFISLGILISSLTENQIVAAVLSFGSLILFFMLGFAATKAGPGMRDLLNYISFIPHLYSFAKGVINTADIVYYLLFIFVCVFLNMRALESKRWRG